MNFHMSLKSGNAKVGPIPVSTSTKETCPTTCAFYATCYAGTMPLGLHWRAVTEGRRGSTWGAFLASVKALPEGQLWRHNQAGDLPGEGDKLDTRALRALVHANKGKRGFTYTHKPMTGAAARRAVQYANENGFTVNLSANTLAHADELARHGVAPVVVVLAQPEGDATPAFTPEGRRVVVCPATYMDDMTCQRCQLCQRQREVIVGFPAHGTHKRAVAQIAKGK